MKLLKPFTLSFFLLFTFFIKLVPLEAGFFDPKLNFKTLSTEHFNIHYPEGLEEAAYRLTVISEKVYQEISPKYDWKPWGRTEVVLTNHTDISNGLTTIIPYNYVIIYLVPPTSDSALNYYDNWLEDLFRHEFFHVIHLDMYGGTARPFRWIFGKIIAPNGLTPSWIREGMAVQEESLTGKGRVHNSFTDMMLRSDIYNDQFLKLDQMAGGTRFEWPSFNGGYIYGGAFWGYLAQTYGQDKVVEFAKRYGRSAWMFSLNHKAKRTFGKHWYHLYRDWKDHLTKKYEGLRDQLSAQGLTNLNDVISVKKTFFDHPTLSPDQQHLLYTKHDYYHKPEIRLRRTDGSEDILIKKGRSGTQFSFSPDGKRAVYSSVGRHKRYYQYSDIHEINLETKKITSITSGKRAYHPDYSPDGNKIVYASNGVSTTRLEIWDVKKKQSQAITPFARSEQFSNPRFSTNGKTIAVSRWTQGKRDIYLYDLQGQVIKQITDDAAIDTSPSFSRDGKNLFFASDRTGITNIYRHHLPTGVTEKISNVLTGVFEPQYANGKVYVKHYTGRTYDLKYFHYQPPYPTKAQIKAVKKYGKTKIWYSECQRQNHEADWDFYLEECGINFTSTELQNTHARIAYTDLPPTDVPEVNLVPKKYNPFKKLFIPRYIQPGFFFTDDSALISLNTGSQDPLGRHRWLGGLVYRTDAAHLGGYFTYLYQRFWPTVFVGFNDAVVNFGDLFRIGQDFFEERLRGFAGVSMDFNWYGHHVLSTSYFYEDRSAESFIPPDALLQPSLGTYAGFLLRYQYSRATRYPASISLEGGPRLTMELQVTDETLGSSSNTEQVIFFGDLREYVPLPLEGHVLAFRLAGGIAFGDRLLQGTFRLGSATGESVISAPSSRLFTLRGLPQITFAGERALLLSGEYRLPLVNVQRGIGTLPIALKKLYMVFFADYGTVFNEDLDFDNFLLGVGGELRGDLVLGYGLPVTLRLGYGIIVSGREFIRGLEDPITGADIQNGALILELGTSF